MQITESKEYDVNRNVINTRVMQFNVKTEKGNFNPAVNMSEKTVDKEDDAAIVEISQHTVDMMKSQLESVEKSEDAFVNYGKMMEIARRIARGDRVPAIDEKKLLEFDEKIYQSAKMQALMAKNRDRKEHESLFEDEDELDEKVNDLEREALGAVELPQIGVHVDTGGQSPQAGGSEEVSV